MKNRKTCYAKSYDSPIGPIIIQANDTAITGIYTVNTGNAETKHESDAKSMPCEPAQETIIQETALIKRAYEELMEYFSGNRRTFDLPLHAEGTEFQMQVWNALREIPYGETCSYKEIAIKTGRPKACRAVGGACHRNPILIMVPCHRVIGTNGSMTGFGGGIPVKEQLLKLESTHNNVI